MAVGVALAAMATGVMAAFALIFIPPWIAFALAPGWRSAVVLAVVAGISAYIAAFAVALLMDLPFGPVFVAMLACLAAVRAMPSAAWRLLQGAADPTSGTSPSTRCRACRR